MLDKLPEGVEHIVRGFCEDYERRREEIRRQALPKKTIGCYIMLNAVIDEAIASCCDEGMCEELRNDIGSRTGHRCSQLSFVSANTYKERKKKTKIAIAKALHLI